MILIVSMNMIKTYTELCDKVRKEESEIYLYFSKESYEKERSDIDERLKNYDCMVEHFMIFKGFEGIEVVYDEHWDCQEEYPNLEDYEDYNLIEYDVEQKTYKRWNGKIVTVNCYHALISKE